MVWSPWVCGKWQVWAEVWSLCHLVAQSDWLLSTPLLARCSVVPCTCLEAAKDYFKKMCVYVQNNVLCLSFILFYCSPHTDYVQCFGWCLVHSFLLLSTYRLCSVFWLMSKLTCLHSRGSFFSKQGLSWLHCSCQLGKSFITFSRTPATLVGPFFLEFGWTMFSWVWLDHVFLSLVRLCFLEGF